MAATIQNIELPKKPRARDTSSSKQEISQELIRNADFSTNESADQPYLNGGLQFDDWVEQQSSGMRAYTTVTGGIRCTAETVTTTTWHQRIYQTMDASQQVVGKMYKISATVLCSRASDFRFNVQETNSTDDQWSPENYDVEAGVDRTIEVFYTCVDATSQVLVFFPLAILTAGQYYEVKNVSLKEVESFPNNNHGEIYSGRALEFDGVTDYLSVSTDVDTEMPHMSQSGTFTVACWVKQGSSKDQTVWYASYTNGNSRVGLGFGNNGEVAFVKYNGTAYTYAGNTAANPVSINNWYRAVCVMTSGSQKMYLNGVELTGTVIGAGHQLGSTQSDKFIIGEKDSTYFDGAISNFQSWDAAWTAADVAYDYANPESLALNASGSALTEGNLKLWYPMQGGHRGQQSYILDGANTGLGVELANFADGNITFNNSGASVASSNSLNSYNAVGDGSTGDSRPRVSFALTTGQTYKIEYTPTLVLDGGVLDFFVGGSRLISNNDINTSFTKTFTSGDGHEGFDFDGSQAFNVDFTLSVKAINDKHNATTVFYGDPKLSDHLIAAQKTDLVSNLDSADDIMVFADAVTDGCDGTLGDEVISTAADRQMDDTSTWTEGTGWAVNGSSSGKAIKTGGGAESLCTHTGTGAAIANRWYKVQYITAGIGQEDGAGDSAGFNVTLGSSDGLPISTADGVHSRLIYTSDTDKLNLNANANTNITLDDVSVKLADGWVICENDADGVATCDGLATGGTMTFVNTDTGEHGRIALPIKATSGRTYRVKADCIDSSSQTMKLGLSDTCFSTSTDADPTFGSAITVGNTGYSTEVVCSNGTLCIYVQSNVTTNDTKVVFDNLTVQEVGVASGWTDADQQLHIPQPALQSYNELAWSGTEAKFVEVDDLAANLGTNNFAISYVINSADLTGDRRYMAFNNGASDGGRVVHRIDPTGILKIYVQDSTSTAVSYAAQSASGAISANKTYHIVESFDRSANLITTYINGVASGVTVDISTLDGNIHCNGDLEFNYWAETFVGIITEVALWKNTTLSAAEALELYNDGKPLDALTHTKASTLYGYWRNNGLSTWVNLANPGTKDTTTNSITETILIPQGIDFTRDNQGFIMNRQRNTSSFNNTAGGGYVEIPVGALDDDLAFLGVGDGFSIEVWIKVNGDSNGALILSRNNNTDGYRLEYNTSEKIVFGIEENNNLSNAATDSAISPNTWYHIVGTFDGDPDNNGSGEMKLYLNGETGGSVTNNNTSADMDTSISPMRIGKHYWEGAKIFDGEIDGVLIYNKVLSLEEVQKNYNATKRDHD